jgi:CBS domain-containing protein
MENPGPTGKAKRVRIYVNEGDLYGLLPIDQALVAFLRKEGAAGATVLRAIEGFGSSGKIHSLRWVDFAERLPVVIEWIERAEQVERLLPQIKDMVKHGLITVENTEIALYCAYPVRDVSPTLHAMDVMSRDVVSIAPDASIREVVDLLLGKTYRAIPVVEAKIPVGMITNSDLLKPGGLSMRVELLRMLDPSELSHELDRLGDGAKNAADMMTPNPVTVHGSAPLTQVAELMSTRRLKRLPVVDDHGALIGIVSRLDLLRTAARTFEELESAPPEFRMAVDTPVAHAMRTDVPTVAADAHLPEILQAVSSTRLNRCFVIDSHRHVLGKITDAELLDRVTPALRPSTLRSLISHLPFTHPTPAETQVEQHTKARTAVDLMIDTAIVSEKAPLRQAIAVMLGGKHKIVAVVDSEDRLVGVLDRADLLHGLVAPKDVRA